MQLPPEVLFPGSPQGFQGYSLLPAGSSFPGDGPGDESPTGLQQSVSCSDTVGLIAKT